MFAGTRILTIATCLSALVMVHAQQTPTRHTVSINGLDLYYEKSGKGDPLLLLHGWTQSSAFWAPYVARFGSDFEVYAIDLRGHGRSSPLTKDFSIRQAARDVEELIKKLQLERVKAIGLSYGGLVLLELASTHRNLIERMVVIGTSYRYNGQEAAKGKPAFAYESLDPAFAAYLKEQHAHGESQIKALFDPTLDYQINLTEAQLQSMQTRVLIVNGDSDEIADIRQAVEMRRLIPRSALWIMPNAGHLALTEDTREAFIRQTKAFFAPSSR
jgi:pimeloyl-ACP methyl ester carboxylesterase